MKEITAITSCFFCKTQRPMLPRPSLNALTGCFRAIIHRFLPGRQFLWLSVYSAYGRHFLWSSFFLRTPWVHNYSVQCISSQKFANVGVEVDTHTRTLSIRIYLWFYGQKARKLVIKKSSKRGPVFVAVAWWRGVVVAVGSRVFKAAHRRMKVFEWPSGNAISLFQDDRTDRGFEFAWRHFSAAREDHGF